MDAVTDTTTKTQTIPEYRTGTGISFAARASLRTVLYIRRANPEWFEKYYQIYIADRKLNEWDLEDDQFIRSLEALIKGYREQASEEENALIESFTTNPESETAENTIPQGLVDEMVAKYEAELPARELRRAEAERAAREYLAELKKQGVRITEQDEGVIRSRISESLEKAYKKPRETFLEDAARTVKGETELAKAQKRLPDNVDSGRTATQTEALFSASWYRNQFKQGRDGALKFAVSDRNSDPATAFDVYIKTQEYMASSGEKYQDPEAFKQTVSSRAGSILKAYETLSIRPNQDMEADIAGEFIKSLSRPGTESAVSRLVALLPDHEKKRVAATLLSQGLDRLLKKPEEVVTRLGMTVAENRTFQEFIRQNLGKRFQAAQAVSGPGSVISDVAVSLLTGPSGRLLLSRPEGAVFNFLEAATIGKRLPGAGEILTSLNNPVHFDRHGAPLLFDYKGSQHPMFSPLSLPQIQLTQVRTVATDAFHYLVQKGAAEVKSRLGGALLKKIGISAASGGLFKFLTGLLGKIGVSTAAGGALGGVLGTVFGGPIGLVVGAVVLPVAAKFFGKFLGKLTSGGFVPGLEAVTRAIAGRFGNQQETPFLKQPGTIAAIAVILPLLLLSSGIFSSLGLGSGYYENAVQKTAFVSNAGGMEEPGSKYIRISKLPSPASFPDNNPGPVTYAVTIEATELVLSNITISDTATIFTESGSKSLSFPPPPSPPSNINPGSPYSYSYVVTLPSDLRDAVVSNLITVTADVEGNPGEYKTTSASVIIGNPPTGCFVPGSSGVSAGGICIGTSTAWAPEEWNTMTAAIAYMSKSDAYMARICSGGSTFPVYRMPLSWGGGCHSAGNVYIYNGGVSSYRSAVYTIAHESGHVLNYVDPNQFNLFRDQEISALEGYLPTYPNAKSESEDFAESIGVYVANGLYPLPWHGKNYPSDFPLHYNFASGLFGGTIFQTGPP